MYPSVLVCSIIIIVREIIINSWSLQSFESAPHCKIIHIKNTYDIAMWETVMICNLLHCFCCVFVSGFSCKSVSSCVSSYREIFNLEFFNDGESPTWSQSQFNIENCVMCTHDTRAAEIGLTLKLGITYSIFHWPLHCITVHNPKYIIDNW